MDKPIDWEDYQNIPRGSCWATYKLQLAEIERLQKSDKIVQLIEELRGDGSDYLTLHCKSRPGDEGLREAVDVVADWTNFKEQWFWGDTLEGALQSAVDAKAAAQAAKGK